MAPIELLSAFPWFLRQALSLEGSAPVDSYYNAYKRSDILTDICLFEQNLKNLMHITGLKVYHLGKQFQFLQ